MCLSIDVFEKYWLRIRKEYILIQNIKFIVNSFSYLEDYYTKIEDINLNIKRIQASNTYIIYTIENDDI